MDDRGGDPGPTERRASPRVLVLCEVTLRRDGGNNYRVNAFNLSATGCKVEMVERLRIGEGVWIKFEGIEPQHATVFWVEPPAAGLQFDRPMHPAVFDSLIRRLSCGPPGL
jgi:hypothetical protein